MASCSLGSRPWDHPPGGHGHWGTLGGDVVLSTGSRAGRREGWAGRRAPGGSKRERGGTKAGGPWGVRPDSPSSVSPCHYPAL